MSLREKFWKAQGTEEIDKTVATTAMGASMPAHPPMRIGCGRVCGKLTLQDPGRKTDVLDGIYETWPANDPERAMAYFHSKGITPPSA